MFDIEKKFTFEAAHILDGLEDGHPCGTLHGHSYKLYIKIYSELLNDNGFIMDFGDLKKFGKEFIDRNLDHSMIITKNSCVTPMGKVFLLPDEYKNTTVEIMCEYILKELLLFFKSISFNNFCKIRIKMFETENNSGSYTYEK